MSKTAFTLSGLPALAALLLAGLSSPASAQVIFEPVQYQYGADQTFYYGGTDPRVFAFAARTVGSDGIAGPRDGHDVHDVRYAVGTSYRGRLDVRPPAVFTDRIPYCDAALLGYTAADARNDANAAVPTYFRKADLMASAVPADGGKVQIVPAQAPQPGVVLMDVRPYRRPAGPATGSATKPATAPATQPADGPRPLLIIPKSLLQPPPAAPAVLPAARTVAVAK